MDLADVAGNVSDGVHIASAAGGWMALVFGFGGVRDFDGQLTIDPGCPQRFRSLGVRLALPRPAAARPPDPRRASRTRSTRASRSRSSSAAGGTSSRLIAPVHTRPPSPVAASITADR